MVTSSPGHLATLSWPGPLCRLVARPPCHGHLSATPQLFLPSAPRPPRHSTPVPPTLSFHSVHKAPSKGLSAFCHHLKKCVRATTPTSTPAGARQPSRSPQGGLQSRAPYFRAPAVCFFSLLLPLLLLLLLLHSPRTPTARTLQALADYQCPLPCAARFCCRHCSCAWNLSAPLALCRALPLFALVVAPIFRTCTH